MLSTILHLNENRRLKALSIRDAEELVRNFKKHISYEPEYFTVKKKKYKSIELRTPGMTTEELIQAKQRMILEIFISKISPNRYLCPQMWTLSDLRELYALESPDSPIPESRKELLEYAYNDCQFESFPREISEFPLNYYADLLESLKPAA